MVPRQVHVRAVKAARLQMWDARRPDDYGRWERICWAWSSREVFAHPAYVSLFAQPTDRPLCAFMETPRGWVLYPVILRQIPEAEYGGIADGATDLTTPYGYGGPFATGDSADYAAAFWEQFDEWAASERVVSEFIRLALPQEALLSHPGEREEKQLSVVRSLDLSEDQLWMDVEHKVRKNVKRARRSGVTIELDSCGDRLSQFMRIYRTTMDRRCARSGFYFPESFFERIHTRLQGQYMYFHAWVGGEIVSTELVLVSEEAVYSFLGGTDELAFGTRPNDLLKYEVMLWAKRAGKRRFVLGGGYVPDDGIFRYKRSFAPRGLVPFSIVRRILIPDVYERLVEARTLTGRQVDGNWVPDAGFFPRYRAELPEAVGPRKVPVEATP